MKKFIISSVLYIYIYIYIYIYKIYIYIYIYPPNSSSENQNYLIARDHKPSIVNRQFSEVKKKTRSEARQKQTKQDKVTDLKFITTYNPALPNIHNIQNNLSILHTDENMKKIFPSKSIKSLYRREKNLKKMLSPSLFPAKPKNSESCIASCKKCDIIIC